MAMGQELYVTFWGGPKLIKNNMYALFPSYFALSYFHA